MSELVGGGPLAGVRVLELAQIMAGPTCGALLADMGADVVKVEKPAGGDDSRRFSEPQVNGESAAFMMLNRNKRSVAIDLRTDGGRTVLHRLVATSDVLVENFRPGTLDALDCGYADLSALNSALVYCSITGWGRTGPSAAKGGFDLVAQGASGIMSVTGEPGGRPVKAGPPVTDINAGILAALGIVAAYVHRLRTGRGQLVDTSLFEAGVHQTFWQSAIYFATGTSPGPTGSAHVLAAPYEAFPTADGWVTVGGANQANWERLATTLEVAHLVDDPRFATNADRLANRGDLAVMLAERFRTASTAHWLTTLDAAGIPAGPINDIAAMVADPQTAARGMVVDLDHPVAGPTRALGLPIAFSATPGSVRSPSPRLGEHTREVLVAAGYTEGEIDALAADGSVLLGP